MSAQPTTYTDTSTARLPDVLPSLSRPAGGAR